MSDKKITFGQTEVKSVRFQNNVINAPGTQVKLEVGTGMNVLLDMAEPLKATVEFIFQAKDSEGDRLIFELVTHTPVNVSSFVDNLDKVIREKYMSQVYLLVNEKIKIISSLVGMNVRIPDVTFSMEE